MASELILHHYESSPFSQKVRLVMGLKAIAYRSVDVPVMLLTSSASINVDVALACGPH